MQIVGMFDAKTHLPQIIRNVQEGETYIITNRNKEVAVLMPLSEYYKNEKKAIYNQIKNIFKTKAFGDPNDIISARDEGKK